MCRHTRVDRRSSRGGIRGVVAREICEFPSHPDSITDLVAMHLGQMTANAEVRRGLEELRPYLRGPDARFNPALVLAPKVYGYLDKSGNPDIQRYRGYADWILRYGKEDGWMLGAQFRRGTAGYGNAQLDLSYPLRDAMFARTGGFLHFQLFSGYGETLLDYNQHRQTQIRIGFSIVR